MSNLIYCDKPARNKIVLTPSQHAAYSTVSSAVRTSDAGGGVRNDGWSELNREL